MHKSFRHVALLAALLAAAPGHCADQPPLTIGILPTFNSGGDNFGSVFGQHLALTLFQQLQNNVVRSVLMNPGGRYVPTDDDWLLDYGKRGDVDYLVITTLLKMQVPDKGNCTIMVRTEILDLKSGTRSGPWNHAVEVSRHDARLDYGALRVSLVGDYDLGPSRLFEKQPLGKAMMALADQVRAQVLQAVRPGGYAAPARRVETSTGSCDLHLKVLYTSKNTAS